MKRFSAAMALLLSMALFGGCGGAKAELALITDTGSVDDQSFNQSAWEGLVRYAEENGVSNQYIQPESRDTAGFLAAIDAAVEDGAATVVCCGSLFEEAVEQAQLTYPDVYLIAIDCEIETPADNAAGVLYAEEQAGFLAGYAAVKEGYRSLGFLGGETRPGVQRYGFGFVQGAEYAARELELEEGSVQLRYRYFGSFEPSDELQQLAETWYSQGVECIFTASGRANESVMAAAERMGGKVIGSDVDQSVRSDSVVTSAVKNVSASVYSILDSIETGSFEGGQNMLFDASANGVALAMESARFHTFEQTEYDTLFTRLQTDTDGIVAEIRHGVSETGSVAGAGIETEAVTLYEAG